MQILKDLYIVSGCQGSNVYAVKTDRALIFIDCGTNMAEAQAMESSLAYWGLDTLPITHVLLTHSHIDHAGNCKYFRGKGAKIAAGPGDCDAVETGDSRTCAYVISAVFETCAVDIRLKDNDVLEIGGLKIECILVPGHTDGGMLFRAEIGGKIVVFSGDTLLIQDNADDVILAANIGHEYNQERYLETLGKIANLRCDVICAGHRRPLIGDAWRAFGWAYAKACVELRQ